MQNVRVLADQLTDSQIRIDLAISPSVRGHKAEFGHAYAAFQHSARRSPQLGCLDCPTKDTTLCCPSLYQAQWIGTGPSELITKAGPVTLLTLCTGSVQRFRDRRERGLTSGQY